MLLNAGMTPNPNWSDPSSIEKGTDWLDAMLRTGSVQNYSLSVSGGDDKKTYYLSGSMLDQKGIVLKTSYRRFSFQSNINLQLKPWLKLSNNLTLSIDNKKSGDWSISDAMFALPVQSIKDPDGKWSGPDGSSLWYGDIRNPVGTATINHNTTKGYNLLTNVSAEITLVKWLKFKSTFGYDAKFWFYNNFTPAYDWKPIAVSESSRYEGSNKSFTYLWDNYFTFDKDFGRHHVDVMAGTSAQNNKYDYFDATKNGYLFDNVSQFNNGSDIKSVDGDVSEWSILSFMARANYTYDDKYLFTTTIRRDGSSRFGSGNKYGLFPSFSGAWRISRESWFKNEFPFINDMKIRVGYGVTGNQEIGNYTFASTYNTGVYVFNGTEVKALSSVTMANPDIHWEEVRQTNIGLDFSLLKNRIAFSVDAYNKKTCDMLVKAAIPITSGYEDVTTTYVNAGKVRNRGIEMSVASTNISNGNFSWKTTVNATYNKNKILDLNSDTPLYQNQYNNSYITIQKVGAPINAFYGYVTDGIFQTKEEVERHALQVGGGTAAGDIKFKDLDNNGIINENDRTIIGNPNPDWIFSIGNTLIYKNFDFSIFLLGVTGNDIYNVNAITSEGMSSATNQTTAVIGRWKGKGTSNSMPRAVYADPNQNCRASDRFIEDGSYLRIKNITLGYKLPEKLTARLRMNTVRINVSCENLATITGYSGFDPEVGVNGIDSNRYPLSRTFSFGININF
jgi:TonB-linked SusC/RagA family outer membrane protein